MGLFDKLFSIKRKLDSEIEAFESQYRDRSCQINPEQVRLLLFKECDWRGRKLLFDSSAIQKVAAGKDGKPDVRQTDNVPSIVEVADGFHYVYKGPASDASVLGEMIFGAVAMNYKSVSLKIHIMDEPKRLMCTKVFCVPTTRRVSRAERRTAEGAEGSTNNMKNRNGSKPLSVPSLREEGVSLSFSLDRGDSGYYGDLSPYSSVGSTCDYFSMFDTWDGSNSQEDFYTFHSPPGRKLSTSSNGSWQRRTFQNIATRFDLGHQSSNLLLVPTPTVGTTSYDSQIYSNSSASTSDSLSSSGSLMLRKNKLGLALLITVADSAEMDLVRRCVEHSPQLQALVCRLRLATIAAGAGGSFVSTLYKATEDAARWLTDLMYGPRLQPMWLNLVTSEPRVSSRLAESLLSDLCAVLAVGDTKTTNFFISTLLTHVLTYHLGWVTTISPYDTVDYQEQPKPTERPYNALWAQLGDLCGAIGHPPRVARTVISGTANSQFLNRLLLVLTYFVRCGDVKRQDFNHNIETTVISVNEPECKKSDSEINVIGDSDSGSTVTTQVYNALVSDSVSTLASQTTLKKSSTLANLSEKLSSGSELFEARERPSSTLRRNPTLMLSLKASSDSSINSSLSDDSEVEQKVVFVLGDDDKLVGLKNKSNGGKSVKKSSKVNEPVKSESEKVGPKQGCDVKSPASPSKCCGQTLQHSKPIKHSGFKFEFDKYPQIVTNYMKSKNLEILDRHYIGKPGNLKLDNFQFDPTIVPSIQEERCEACVKCQMMESMLQTPTNASEMEYMNDMPRQLEPQYATESVVVDPKTHREMSPKTFVRRRKENTVVVNIDKTKPDGEARRKISREKERDRVVDVKQVLKFPVPELMRKSEADEVRTGFDASLLGGVTDHYVPDLILQGTLARPNEWEKELRRDLNLTSYLNKTLESPIQAVAILGDTNTWEVRVVGRDCGSGGMSSLVGAMLDALPVMWKAKVPAHHCLSFLEDKLREFCVLSKTLADMLMSTDFCDITTLTKALNIDVNDVPLLLAVATTHTPQVATRYGISYR